MKRKKGWIVSILIFLIILVLILIGSYFGYLFVKSSQKSTGVNAANVVVQNPMNSIKSNYISTNSSGNANSQLRSNNGSLENDDSKIIEEGVREFNDSYINYILLGIGVDKLHSAIGYGNPIILTIVNGEEWNSEIINSVPSTSKGSNANCDIRVILSKEEAVKAILSNDIKIFMKNSVSRGNTKIEMVAGNVELFGKGYLSLYNDLK
jgi:hypothetical protein